MFHSCNNGNESSYLCLVSDFNGNSECYQIKEFFFYMGLLRVFAYLFI